jgi:hypothetical protein
MKQNYEQEWFWVLDPGMKGVIPLIRGEHFHGSLSSSKRPRVRQVPKLAKNNLTVKTEIHRELFILTVVLKAFLNLQLA